MMKRVVSVFVCMLLAMSLVLTGCSSPKTSAPAETAAEETSAAQETPSADEITGTGASAAEASPENAAASEDLHHVEIAVKDYGTIKAELYGDKAPITVENFLNLAGDGFYDGLTFHRIIDGFMIQGGDPLGNGTGGSSEHITGEFRDNGIENDISHLRGVISMARSQEPNSASSQFFIVQTDSTYLDGAYAAFGMVTEGMDIVDAICKDTPVQDTNGTVDKADQPVIESITVID